MADDTGRGSDAGGVLARRSRAVWVRVLGGVLGIALVLAAAVVALRSPVGLGDAASRAWGGAWWMLALAVLLPFVNWLTTTAVFSALYARFGRVGYWEHAALLGSARLLNYLPMRPGLAGRVAYLRAAHGVRVVDSARVTLDGLVLSVGLLLLSAALALVSWRVGAWVCVGGMACVGAGSFLLAAIVRGGRQRGLALAGGWKVVDIGVWSLRAWVFFGLVGRPIDAGEAVAVTVVAHAASLVPLAGNGLGLREWAVAALAVALPSGVGGAGYDAAALSAEVLHRGVDVVCAVLVGVVASAWVGRRLRRDGAGEVREPAGGGVRSSEEAGAGDNGREE